METVSTVTIVLRHTTARTLNGNNGDDYGDILSLLRARSAHTAGQLVTPKNRCAHKWGDLLQLSFLNKSETVLCVWD